MPGSRAKVSAKIKSKYELASAVKVSNFVSINVSIHSNDYKIWKTQMLSLIESQDLLHFIDAEHPSPVDESVPGDVCMILKFNNLVKSWILQTVDQYRRKDIQDLDKAQDVWMKVKDMFDRPEGDPAQKQVDKYKQVLGIDVSDYVKVNLSGSSNYYIWKAQMLCLIESQELLHIVTPKYPFPEEKGVHMISNYEKVVNGWISTTMRHQLLKDYIDYPSVQSIWRQLEFRFNRPISYKEQGDSVDVSTLREDLKYIQVSTVNVSSFVSVKLSGHENYSIWKAQMMCLLNSQELLHIIDFKARYYTHCGPMNKKYEDLVKGWIFATMDDQLLQIFANTVSVQSFWEQLQSGFSTGFNSYVDVRTKGIEFRAESLRNVPEITITDMKRLHEAVVEGCWWKVKSILKKHKQAATEAISENGNTILHLAVQMGHNYFVENLLEFLNDGENIKTIIDDMCKDALRVAIMVGNEYAVQLLVQKRKQLSENPSLDGFSPLNIAYANRKFNIYTYLLKATPPSDFNTNASDTMKAMQTAIFTKEYVFSE